MKAKISTLCRIGALVMVAALAAVGCGDDQEDVGATSTGGGGTGGGGVGGGGVGGGGGSGGGAPLDCEAVRAQIVAWLDAHQSCSDAAPCTRLDPPALPQHPDFCNALAAPGEDGDELQALLDAWSAAQCTEQIVCGFEPGEAQCVNGTCQLSESQCHTCDPTELDPMCTVHNQNAINACYAEHCLMSEVAHPGFCDDSPECVAAGGTCEETFSFDPPCPDGTRWDTADPEHACPNGNLWNTCCIPWAEPCSFVAGSMTLSLDPFTCAAPTGQGAPWMCLHQVEQSSCTLDSVLEQSLGETHDATVTMVAQLGSVVTVQGTHNQTGRTFVCTGEVSYDVSTQSPWSCETCDAGGTTCETCTIGQSWRCTL